MGTFLYLFAPWEQTIYSTIGTK